MFVSLLSFAGGLKLSGSGWATLSHVAAFVSTGQEPVQVQHPFGDWGQPEGPTGQWQHRNRALGTHHRLSLLLSLDQWLWAPCQLICHKTFSLSVWMISASETFSQLHLTNAVTDSRNVLTLFMFVGGKDLVIFSLKLKSKTNFYTVYFFHRCFKLELYLVKSVGICDAIHC